MKPAGLHLAVTDAERRRLDDIDRLVALGGSAGDLVAALGDPSWTVRRAVVSAVAALGDELAPRLCAWLASERTSEHAIAAAVDALSASVGAGVDANVARLLVHPVPAVAADAAAILGRRRSRASVPALAAALAHPDDNVAVAAIEALGAIGGNLALDALVAAAGSGNFFRVFPALQVLGRTGDPRAIAPIAALVGDDLYRAEAVCALGRTGSVLAIAPLARAAARGSAPDARLAGLALADLLERAEWNGSAGHAMATLRANPDGVRDRLAAALAGADPDERNAIARVLGAIASDHALPALGALLELPGTEAAATAAIQEIGRVHDSALARALASPDSAVRLAVLPIVDGLHAAPAVRVLLVDDLSEIRARACAALARIGDTEAVPALFELLADPSPRVAHAATAAIQALGSARTGELVAASLASDLPGVRRHGLRIAAYLGCREARDAVLASLADPDAKIAALAVAALAAFDREDLADVDDRLFTLARDAREDVRAAAVRALGVRTHASVGEMLVQAVADDSPWVRYYACHGLGRHPGIPAHVLVGRLADAAPQVRIAAIEALAHLATPAAHQALVSLVRSADADVRRAALAGLGLAPQADALPHLLEAATSPDVATRLIALAGLARIYDPRALAGLAAAARDDVREVREATLSLLGERDDDAAAELLVDIALAQSGNTRAHAALSRRGDARRRAIAMRLAGSDDRDAPVLAAALGRMGDVQATEALFDALATASPPARRAAAATLAATDAAGARAAISKAAVADPDPEVRRACAAAIAR